MLYCLLILLLTGVASGHSSIRRSLVQQAAQTVCDATDTLRPAVCLKSSHPEIYKYSKALVRIKVVTPGYLQYCTGWLVGCEGHVMTNAHCFAQDDVTVIASAEFEFMAEGKSCTEEECSSKGACSQTKPITNATMVVKDVDLDFALLKLPDGERFVKAFGYLKLQPFAPMVNQQIYIPQHPQGHGKRIAALDDQNQPHRITSIKSDHLASELDPSSCAFGDVVGYRIDTYSGSSGSPVIDLATHCVVALHFCGQCKRSSGLNAGIPMNLIAHKLLRLGKLPNCSLVINSLVPAASGDLENTAFKGNNLDLDLVRVSDGKMATSDSASYKTSSMVVAAVVAIKMAIEV